MVYQTININPLHLVLDEQNPRFVTKNSDNLSQEKIMEYLIKYEGVIQLAKDINDYNGLVAGERLLVIKEDNKYKVLEGNRRTAAMHLLLNPSSVPDGLSISRLKQIPKINSRCLENISTIEVDLVESRDDAIYALTKRHIDGIKKWSQISKMFFYKNLFDQGKKLNELKEFTGESTGSISNSLKKYNFLRFILDHYHTYFPESTIATLEIETDLDTDFIVNRIFSFICNELSIDFAKKTYEMDLTKLGSEQKDLLIEILVKISYLYWGDDGVSSIIDSRSLNTQTEIRSFFTNPNHNIASAVEISKLIKKYKNTGNAYNDENSQSRIDNQDESNSTENSKKQTDPPSENIEPDNDSAGEPNEELQKDAQTEDGETDQIEKTDDNRNVSIESPEPNKSGGYKPRDPSSYSKLTSAYKITHFYKTNPRINKTKKEISDIDYKEYTISSMYLIRSLLESYVNDYIDTFASLPRDHKYRMTGINNKREKRKGKELQELIYDHIKNHLKHTIDDYAETHQLIEVTFSKNNNTSAMKIINFHIHSSTHYPDKNEILEAWSKISTVINTLDLLLGEIT